MEDERESRRDPQGRPPPYGLPLRTLLRRGPRRGSPRQGTARLHLPPRHLHPRFRRPLRTRPPLQHRVHARLRQEPLCPRPRLVPRRRRRRPRPQPPLPPRRPPQQPRRRPRPRCPRPRRPRPHLRRSGILHRPLASLVHRRRRLALLPLRLPLLQTCPGHAPRHLLPRCRPLRHRTLLHAGRRRPRRGQERRQNLMRTHTPPAHPALQVAPRDQSAVSMLSSASSSSTPLISTAACPRGPDGGLVVRVSPSTIEAHPGERASARPPPHERCLL
mmetsp:Transcript_10597/g.33874  ORF Transcript_10597/g.33874 Transcript_10597/m.33874 type:complete len:274 (+) Transcript_10597:404-1225(+)